MDHNDTLLPGQNHIFSANDEFPRSILLLIGPSGSGKTAYSIQFLREGIASGDRCLYVSCSQTLTHERFISFFGKKEGVTSPSFLTLSSSKTREVSSKEFTSQIAQGDNNWILSDLLHRVAEFTSSKDNGSAPMRIVVDSLTHLIARFSSETVQKFVSELYDLLKSSNNTIALFTLTTTASTPAADVFGSLVDGIIQLRMEDQGDEVQRDIRILSLKTARNTPRWTRFRIKEDGELQFGQDNNANKQEYRCKLCERPIIGPVASTESESPFHPQCLDMYKKLGEIYGSNVIYGLQPGVINASFFFIDIVGLSDPSLSVENQTRKIEDLNGLIGSCDAFNKVPKANKIILPTGDGMAIGFLMNPELPLQLSIQLHRKLRTFNARTTADRTIGVRIGLNTGPVFVVSDINSNQNVWGPGIILARRVMDLGDSGHILLADNIADTLLNLKDEYRESIRPVSTGYRIKHGQMLRLYSAYSNDFGNPEIPTKISEDGST